MGHVFVVIFNVVVVRLIVKMQQTHAYPNTFLPCFLETHAEQTGDHGRRGRRGLKGEPGIPGLDGREGIVDCKVLVLYLFVVKLDLKC